MIFFKKSQTSFFDFIVGFTIFVIVLLIFFNSSTFSSVKNVDSDVVVNIVLSDGIPNNWNESFYYKPGILSYNKLNETKFLMFYNLSKKNSLKNIFNSNFMFRIYYYNNSNIVFVNVSNVSYISSDYNFSFDNISNFADNVKVEERIINYNNNLYIIKFLFWN